MAIDASHGKEGGVKFYASRAKEAGATEKEIFEAVRVATLICGTGGQTTALRGLEKLIRGAR
jgi:alkylhydroperoxidase/carboxymuconolactone decarboxylase family protein YurZ